MIPLLLLRHGETDYPEERFYNDRLIHPPLSPRGIEQARAASAEIRGRLASFRLFASPSVRTRQTASLLAEPAGIEPTILDDLSERRLGEWDGKSAAELKRETSADWERFRSDPDFSPPGGESLSAFSARVRQIVETIVKGGTPAVAVTHTGVIRVAVARVLEIPLTNLQRLVIPPGSLTILEFTSSFPNLTLLSAVPTIVSPSGN